MINEDVRPCKVLSFFSTFLPAFFVWEFSTLLRNATSTWLRRVKYYKHVTSDLCFNITWGNRRTELAGEQQLTYLSPLQLKGTVELVAVSQLSSYQPGKPFPSIVGHGSKPLSKNTWVHRLWDTPRRRTFLKILDINIISGQTSRDGSDPKELLSIDHPCHLKNRNAPKYIFMKKRHWR